ncbi:hypothetical protein RFM41_16685 [Mesorhizobium sp. VK25A]|uniref:Uncharacterized protein n=1 Tax=Mesorhizobium vachelliae TaxID=3072309 RepID=A0ABU5A3P1_9HYPH|nr:MULTISPECIES: hypothetical protein [unclassified Mesorhizobium]MDX8532309.1 hypothetical protein [Mesorhizobium sp. VK25D]MDX8545387.1 hypothetical protein [Mesorhizobium sp. VK25A]
MAQVERAAAVLSSASGQDDNWVSIAVAGKLEQFQEKCETVFRPELRKNKGLGRFGDSVKG